MRVECVKLNLKDALLTAERFTGKQLSLPVLRYVLFIATEKVLKLRATNLDIGIEIEIPARIEKEGVIAIPADILGSFLSNLPNEKNIIIEQIGEHLTITGSSYSTLIKGFGYEDFPTIPFVSKGISFDIDVKTLISGFKATQFAVAVSDIKPEFSSVYCYSNEQGMVMVATDSSRLSEKIIPIKNINEQFSILIPGKNVNELIRALENTQGKVLITTTKNQISFKTEQLHITSRLIDGVFPDYKQIIPKTQNTEVVVLRQDFIDRLKLTTVFSGKLQQIRLKIYPQDKIFEIESRNDDIGETSQQIEGTLKGDPVEFLLNQRFIIDVLTYLSTDSVVLYANGNNKPLIIKGVSDHSFTYLVMPMKG